MYTQYNGSITVSTCVTSFPPPPSKPSRASGRKARLRRKKKRAASQTKSNATFPITSVKDDQNVPSVDYGKTENYLYHSVPSEQNQVIRDSALGHQRNVNTAAAVSLGVENENTDLLIDFSCENSDPLPTQSIDLQKKELPLPILPRCSTQPTYAMGDPFHRGLTDNGTLLQGSIPPPPGGSLLLKQLKPPPPLQTPPPS